MHRCRSFVLALFAIGAMIALSGCLGKSTSSTGIGNVKSISLNPAGNFSLEIGSSQVFSASALDGNNHAIPGVDIQFIVSALPGSTAPAPISMTSNGNACAGTWDATQALCSPGSSGIAIVTATANGVLSPQAIVYVHQHIDAIKVTQAKTVPPTYDCFSQGQTWLYQGTAYSNGLDITNTVGQLNWEATNSGVLTMNTNPPQPIPLPLNQVQITAESPGITQLSAFVSGTTSSSIPITTCLVQYVRLQAAGTTSSTVNVGTGSAISLQATAVDTLGYPLTRPPLTWISSNPEVVSFSSLTTNTGTNSAAAHMSAGGADLSASCSPPTCNIGVLPGTPNASAMPAYVFASEGPASPLNPNQAYGAISVIVSPNGSTPTYNAWAATDGCDPDNTGVTNGCSSVMFNVTPTTSNGTNPIGASVLLPRTPNSIMFNHQSRIYIGSDQGLMYVDIGSAPSATLVSPVSTPCQVSLCGVVKAISNDGKQVVVADTVSTTHQVYIYNAGASSGGTTVTDLVLPEVATAAAFSPDESKIFILTGSGTMYVYSTVDALAPVTLPASESSGTDAVFSPDGSFAYVAGSNGTSGSVSAFSTCALPGMASVELGSPVVTSGSPAQLFPFPNLQTGSEFITQNVLVFEPPSVQILTAEFTQVSLPLSQYVCNPPVLSSLTVGPANYLGEGNFTPVYANLVDDGTKMIIVARFIPAVLIYDVASGTIDDQIQLPGSYDPRSASASNDGSEVFVAACDQYPNNDPGQPCSSGAVYAVNTTTDYVQRVPYINNTTNNMCSGQGEGAPICFPDLIVIKPQ
ncbi:MAG: hypothetical protein WBS24_10955 [Terriglobales bacterium]